MDEEVREAEVFAESSGKTGFPGFGFVRTGRNHPFLGPPGRWGRRTAAEGLDGRKTGVYSYSEAKREVPWKRRFWLYRKSCYVHPSQR